MSISVLPNPTIYRRNTTALIDFAGRLWIHGESYTSTGLQDSTELHPERYDPSTSSWSTLTASPLYQYAYGWVEDGSGRVIIAGGLACISGGTPNESVQGSIYDPSTNTWTAIADLPAEKAGVGTWWQYGGLLYVASTAAPTVHYTGGTGGTWASAAANPPETITSFNASTGLEPVDVNAHAYITRTTNASALYYDINADTWTLGAAPSVLVGKSWCWDGVRYLYFLGPYSNNTVAQSGALWQYDTVGNVWTQLATAPVTFNACACVATSSAVYIVGAFKDFTPSFDRTIYAYDIASNTWSATADVLSEDHLGTVVKDTLGAGYYIVEGRHIVAGFSSGSNVVEYWTPGAAARPRPRSYGMVIG